MNKLFQSVALIRRTDESKSQILLRQQPDPIQWNFIVGERLNRESFLESVTREVAWQLNLDRKTDFLVSKMAQLSMEYVETTADGTEQHIAVAFYNVQIYRRAILDSLAKDQSCLWVSAAEVCQGTTTDGQVIDPNVVHWINKWNVVQPWQ